MGEAKSKAPVYDRRFDKSFTTVGDIEVMKEQVHEWCDMVQKHLEDGLALGKKGLEDGFKAEALARDANLAVAVLKFSEQLAAVQQAVHDETVTLANRVEEYRSDELRYRQSRTWRGRMRRWFGIAQPAIR